MASSILKKRKHEPDTKLRPSPPTKKPKKQTHYSSSSSADEIEPSDFPAIDLASSASSSDIDLEADDKNISINDNENPPNKPPPSSTPHSSPSTSDSEPSSSDKPNPNHTPLALSRAKRNDPTAFSTAITSILSSKLPTTKRADPVLALSSTALAANREIKDAQVEKLARQSLRAEKKAAVEKGRVKDVLLGTVNTGFVEAKGGAGVGVDGEVGRMMEQERRLKKTAQRGVVKLFNAVRVAQVRGEEARKEAVGKGIVGAKRREENVGEMSKKGFLEFVASGGGGGKAKVSQMGGKEVEET
ncbi:MAG: hypothetical protein L6R42_007914 [Xanthoria sp. 1 TBL-2021]|nr:MAG: hypothetical protein L6R42_007914 [Xanthoria sp. 1 TBL-2021]